MTDTLATWAPPADIVRVTRTREGTELYFPPRRMPEVALALGAFGVIGTALTGLTVAALLSALATPATLLMAVLLATFIVPFMVFGVMCIATAIYMVSNALHVRVDAEQIDTVRLVFGVIVKRRRIERSAIAAIEPEIASRYQSVFGATPIYQLVARSADQRRVVVAETLKGDTLMEQIRLLIENPLGSDTREKT